jgi:hypothetical protein
MSITVKDILICPYIIVKDTYTRMTMNMRSNRMPTTTVRPNGHDHATFAADTCPYCGAPATAASRARIAKVESDLKARIAREVAKAEAQANAVIERAKREAARAAEAAVATRLRAQRDVAEKKLAEAVATERTKAYGERMQLDAQLADLQRRLQRRTANELGDSGEVDLLEILTTEFPADQIARVGKGVNGPDIVHRVSGCGATIVYDSKNHKVWANKWTTKLRDDMKTVSPAADHAVLVSTVFPRGEHHGLLYRDGVMVVSPTRVIPVAHLMRRHALQVHTLRLSNDERAEKTVQLYVLLTSNQTADLWQRHSEGLRGLLDIENSDSKHQEKTRNQRLEVISGLQSMIHEDLLVQIDRIISGGGPS